MISHGELLTLIVGSTSIIIIVVSAVVEAAEARIIAEIKRQRNKDKQ